MCYKIGQGWTRWRLWEKKHRQTTLMMEWWYKKNNWTKLGNRNTWKYIRIYSKDRKPPMKKKNDKKRKKTAIASDFRYFSQSVHHKEDKCINGGAMPKNDIVKIIVSCLTAFVNIFYWLNKDSLWVIPLWFWHLIITR